MVESKFIVYRTVTVNSDNADTILRDIVTSMSEIEIECKGNISPDARVEIIIPMALRNVLYLCVGFFGVSLQDYLRNSVGAVILIDETESVISTKSKYELCIRCII